MPRRIPHWIAQIHHSLRPVERILLIWIVAVSLGLGILLWSAQQDQKRTLEQCADPRGQLALRHQWVAIRDIIADRRDGKASAEETNRRIVQQYEDAIREAGPAPPCLEVVSR